MWVTLIYTQEHTHIHYSCSLSPLFLLFILLWIVLMSICMAQLHRLSHNYTHTHTHASIFICNPCTFIQMAIIKSDLHHAYLRRVKASNHRNSFTPCRNLQPSHANQQLFPGTLCTCPWFSYSLSSYQASDMDTAAQRLASTSVEPEMHPQAISAWYLKQISHRIFSPHAARRNAGEATARRKGPQRHPLAETLTCGAGPLGGTGSALFGAEASALQKSLKGAVFTLRGHAAKPLGAAQGVNPAGLPRRQHGGAGRPGRVPGGPARARGVPIFAGQAVFVGAQATRKRPGSTVDDQQQDNGHQVGKERHLASRSQVLHARLCRTWLMLFLEVFLFPLSVSLLAFQLGEAASWESPAVPEDTNRERVRKRQTAAFKDLKGGW